ncbi:molybdopterin molybdotransferase MoeA [Rothia sp. AR01]|uniref:Molybdopterin molybdenumtransferase n=1 Tax=Rothia santali TaxID=2949643 RepID=A0A9X2KGX1_9MICC|nr:molybdopterin molybdotransferase MoeA [Rothia santali]
MIPWEEHRERLLTAARPLPAATVPLSLAGGCVLASDVVTRWPVPLFDNSAMDGYAVRRAEAPEGARLAVVADVAAGSAEDPELGAGEAARIMTGAPVPTAADAVVPLEATVAGPADARGVPGWIEVTAAPAPGAHVRRRGEDLAAGSVSLSAGVVLGPWQLAAAAAAGHAEVTVHRRPRVAVISTGTELIDPAGTPRRGQIPESNSVLLAAALRASGLDLASVDRVRDDEGERLARLVDAAEADAVILTGGASVGAYDVVKEALAPRGVAFDRIGIQPGKPQGFGTRADGAPIFALPGNPVAVATSFEVFVRPALLRLAGRADPFRREELRRATAPWRCPAGRAQVLPVVLDGPDGVAPATAGGSGSHLVASLAAAEALAIVPASVERVMEGDEILVMMLA